MFLLDSFLIFTLDKIRQVAELQLEEGAIDEETFAQIERDVFARLRDLRGGEATSGVADSSAFADVEIEVAEDERS